LFSGNSERLSVPWGTGESDEDVTCPCLTERRTCSKDLNMPTNVQSDAPAPSKPAPRGGFGLPTILLCAAMALMIAVYIFSVVESPTIWRQTGIIP
jgi:hypothetical protein